MGTATAPPSHVDALAVVGSLRELSERIDVGLAQDVAVAELAALARCAAAVRYAHREAIRAALGEPDLSNRTE